MQIYVLRHGIAEDVKPGGSDADRELTSEGRKKLRDVLRAASNADVKPDVVVSSPLVRAMQTAEIAMEVLDYKDDLLQSEALVPSSDPESVWDEIRVHHQATQLMIVGHEPLLSRVVAFLLNAPSLLVDMKKGAMVRIDLQEFGAQPRGVLKWIVIPRLVG